MGTAEVPAALPYHCPTLKGDFLHSPCGRQVAAAQERRQKFPQAVMPYGLEQCLRCQGKDLVSREVRKDMKSVAEFKSVAEAERVLGPGKVSAAAAATAPPCPRHPDEPQIACKKTSKRAGQYMGACLICMADRRAGKPLKDKMTPAVRRDFRKNGARDQGAGEGLRTAGETPAPLMPAPTGPVPPEPRCSEHPERPAVIDIMGRNMGKCKECLSARGREGGLKSQERKATAQPFFISLNQGKYAELKVWLEETAEDNERTLPQQIMFLLRQARRQESA